MDADKSLQVRNEELHGDNATARRERVKVR
jgi:hypothetical protein